MFWQCGGFSPLPVFFMQIKTFIERERLFRFLSGATAVS
jgi:hypothetical protein